MRDEFVRDFWREFEEEEYEGDVLKLGEWRLFIYDDGMNIFFLCA
jgi:hypothetical protein